MTVRTTPPLGCRAGEARAEVAATANEVRAEGRQGRGQRENRLAERANGWRSTAGWGHLKRRQQRGQN